MVKKVKVILVNIILILAMSLCGCYTNKPQVSDNSSALSVEKVMSTEMTVSKVETVPESVQEPEPEPLEVPTFEKTEVSLLMAGDVLCHKGVFTSGYYADGTVNFDHIFANTREDIEAADLAIINQETMLGGKELELSGYPRFNSPFEISDAIVNAGFDAVLFATNHTIDKGSAAVDNCLNYMKEHHPDTAVIGIHDAEFTDYSTQELYVYEKGGIKIAVLNYTYGTNGIANPEGRPLIVNRLDEEKITMDVKKAKELANFVVVCPHWGTEYVYKPTAAQKKWTELFYELGVDLVIGAHPHVLENVEWIESSDNDHKMLVYYSLGNFISTQDKKPRMIGGMAKVNIFLDKLENVEESLLKTNGGEIFTVEFPDEWKGRTFVKKEGLQDDERGTEEDYYVIDGALTADGAAIAGLPAGTKEGDELVVFINDASIEPVVCHRASGVGKITVYKLSDYTEALAKKNLINRDDSGFTLDYIYDLCEEILGDWYERP